MSNLLRSLDEQFSKNLQTHGQYLADPNASEDKLMEAIDALVEFVPDERREHVRQEVLNVVKANQTRE